MLTTLTLLAEDAKTAHYLDNEDCVVARSLKRVLKPECSPCVGSASVSIYRNGCRVINVALSRKFYPEEMRQMAELNENRTIEVEIPDEFLL